ncbi:MAG TPA: DUF5597 domain-containing protein [Rhodanobacteraceae bacterium]|nr:DUF5597 domain-containing protein [Rhodanobacteraceae bacterium]
MRHRRLATIERSPGSRAWWVAAFAVLALIAGTCGARAAPAGAAAIPHLAACGPAIQLHVDGSPYLMLGGELTNSASSSPGYMDGVWARLRGMHLNTVLLPVSWQQIEPRRGAFDFSVLDDMVRSARAHHLHLVLLWFGSWKNSTSSYAPSWVKRDYRTFPRARLPSGEPTDILSALSAANVAADSAAFAALLAHVKRIDGVAHTILMVQVENEVGMLEASREHGAVADAAYAAQVPQTLMAYLATHRATLRPWLLGVWKQHGFREHGTWREVFGAADGGEIFTAWWDARYVNAVARAGKQAYDLPMYVNAALNRPGKRAGEFPSGGPVPRDIDIWKAAAPAIDFLSPDIYFYNFGHWLDPYHRPDNATFIPETRGVRSGRVAANAAYAFGEDLAMGFSPFAIDTLSEVAAYRDRIARVYGYLAALSREILAAQCAGTITGFHSVMTEPGYAFQSTGPYAGPVDLAPQVRVLGNYRFRIEFDRGDPHGTDADGQLAGGLLMETAPGTFIVAGSGVTLSFGSTAPDAGRTGIDMDWELLPAGNGWRHGRLLNGDDTVEGRVIRLPPGEWSAQEFSLYDYR